MSIYSPKSIAKKAKSVGNLYFGKKRAPLFFTWMLTNRCNGTCVYCDIPKRPKDELSKERIFELLDEMADAGVVRVGFYGGEPLLRDDIHEIVKYAKSKDLIVHIYTNGTFVENHIETLKILDGVFISLDGDEAAHDEVRGKGSHARAIKGINICKEYTAVYLLSVITNKNTNMIPYLADYAKDKQCYIIFQTVTKLSSLSPDVSGLTLTNEQMVDVFNEINKLKCDNRYIAHSKPFLDKLSINKIKPLKAQHQLGWVKCWFGRAMAHIDSNGTLNTCSLMIDKEKAISLKDHSFREAWEHIQDNVCSGCNLTCGIEYNMWLSLHPAAILNVIKMFVNSCLEK